LALGIKSKIIKKTDEEDNGELVQGFRPWFKEERKKIQLNKINQLTSPL
jgi:hypothetical protein